MTEYTISYARFLLRSWGFTRKVPMGRHVKRASRQKIAWFRKKLGPLIGERTRAGYTACVQDEAICVADARLRKGVYTPKGVRGVYTYTGSHSKTVVLGLITLDGEGFFRRYGSFTGKEFVEFLKAACERFGKILMITYGGAAGALHQNVQQVTAKTGLTPVALQAGHCYSHIRVYIRSYVKITTSRIRKLNYDVR